MNICHISDSHGNDFVIQDESEIIIHTGDWLPNISRGDREIEPKFQAEWLNSFGAKLKEKIGDKPLLVLQGNHEGIKIFDQIDILKYHKIDAYNITNRFQIIDGVKIYGFAGVNFMNGEWWWEYTPEEMSREIRKLKDILLENNIDVLCTHAPLGGILDLYNGEHIGNWQLTNLFNYVLPPERFPKWILCGHVHLALNEYPTQESRITEFMEMKISNAATHSHLIEI